MTSRLSLLAVVAALAACTPAPAPQATVEPALAPEAPATPAVSEADAIATELGHIYEINISEAPDVTCLAKLDPDDIHPGPEVVRLAWVEARCAEVFPALGKLARWTPTAGGSLSLLDAEDKSIGDFSPVQDGTGVYIRGGVGGKLFDLRTPNW